MDSAAIDQLTIDMGTSSEILMSVTLALMMLAVALGLKPVHFSFFKTNPRHYFIGVLTQIIGLPLVTLILVNILNPMPSLALGMILVACCPGGNISNLLVLFARGNTALSVSLTATSSLLAAFLTPVSILFWSGLYTPTRDLLRTIDFDAIGFLIQTMMILGLPIIVGMLMVRFVPNLSRRIQKPLGLLAAIALIAIILIAFYKYRELIPKLGLLIIPLVVLHNAIALGLGYFAGWSSRADTPTRRALTFEIGIQNSGLGFVILVTQLSGLGGAAAITGMWGLWHIVAGGFLVMIFRLTDRIKARARYV